METTFPTDVGFGMHTETINRKMKEHVQMRLKTFPHWTLAPLACHLCYSVLQEQNFLHAFQQKLFKCLSGSATIKQMCHIISNDKSTYFFLLLMMFILRVRGRIT